MRLKDFSVVCVACEWSGHRVARTEDYDGVNRYGQCPKCQGRLQLRTTMHTRRRAVAMGDIHHARR